MLQGFPPPSKYKVLIRCNTFNQSKYIEDTLKGFAMQQTTFPFLVYVIDDASTDGEQEVLRRWIDTHCNHEDDDVYDNDLAVLLMSKDKDNENCIYAIHLLKKNLFMKPEKQELHKIWRNQCEYEASCEGDDYWIDPLKLQKQVDYFESHPDCGLVYTQAEILQQATGEIKKNLCKTYNDLKDMLTANPIATLTVMYRMGEYNKYQEEVQPSSKGWLMGDYPLYLWFEINSKIGFIPDVTSMYRMQTESASHSSDIDKNIRFIESHRGISLFFIEKYNLGDRYRMLVDNYYYRHVASAYSNHKMKLKAVRSLFHVKQKTIKDYLRMLNMLVK